MVQPKQLKKAHLERSREIQELEEKYKDVVSYVLNNGGVLENAHIHFDEEAFEQKNEDKEPPNKKTRKLKTLVKKESDSKLTNQKKISFLQAYKRCQQKKNVQPYGNEGGYYKKRIGSKGIDDPRLLLFKQEWFKYKDILDVGCHEGYITITVAQMYLVNTIHGIDIDEELITKAYQHLEDEATSPSCTTTLVNTNVDVNFDPNYGSDGAEFCDALSDFEDDEEYNLSERVSFEIANILKYKIENGCVDTILCLSVTKWIHLNWGDKGLMQLFQKMFDSLRPGGILILEPQPWKSYRKNRKKTETIHENYLKLTLRPDNFTNILINEIGFNSCQLISRAVQGTEKGFNRPMYLYTK